VCFLEEIYPLRLFNEKAEKLLASEFVKYIREKKRLSVTISARRGEEVKTERILPDQNAIDAFVLTFRFFIQKREKSSFRHLSKTYEKLPTSQELKNKFLEARRTLNSFLDQGISITIGNETPSRRRLLNIFIYGGLAHADPEKKKIFDEWRKIPMVYHFVEAEFCSILEKVLRVILYVSDINTKAIHELEKMQT